MDPDKDKHKVFHMKNVQATQRFQSFFGDYYEIILRKQTINYVENNIELIKLIHPEMKDKKQIIDYYFNLANSTIKKGSTK